MNKEYLWEKLGSDLQAGLRNPDVFEIQLNADGKLWYKVKEKGNVCIGEMGETEANTFVHALAQFCDKYLNDKTPYLDTTLPFGGERVSVQIPPITERPSFTIRKKALAIFTLSDYEKAEIITASQRATIETAIRTGENILISGSPFSGKTTLANACLDYLSEIAPEGHRVLILEQVPELQCNVKNKNGYIESDHLSMNTLLWISMRNTPERIIIGEVRDGAALAMLKAWNTGTKGGIATIHSNSPEAAVQRVLDLACEVTETPPYALVSEAIDMVVQIEQRSDHPAGRKVTGIAALRGFSRETKEYFFENLD